MSTRAYNFVNLEFSNSQNVIIKYLKENKIILLVMLND